MIDSNKKAIDRSSKSSPQTLSSCIAFSKSLATRRRAISVLCSKQRQRDRKADRQRELERQGNRQTERARKTGKQSQKEGSRLAQTHTGEYVGW